MNRRGFIGSIVGLPLIGRLFAYTTDCSIGSICVACGANWHKTSGCPINNTAMGTISAIRFDGGTLKQAAVFVSMHLPSQRFAHWGGQEVFPIIGPDGKDTGSFIAYAIPRDPAGTRQYKWPEPESTQAVVRLDV